jgi:CRP-like cAMP-binding protein
VPICQCHKRDNVRVTTDLDLVRPAADVLAAALSQMPSATASALRGVGHCRRWTNGEVLLRAGDDSPAVLLLLDGRLKLTAVTAAGDEVLFRWLAPGEMIGLTSVLGQVPLPTSAVADGEVQAFVLERQQLLRYLNSDAQAAMYFAGVASRHGAHLADLLVRLHGGSLCDRIVGVLSRIAGHEAVRNGGAVKLRMTHLDIANAVGASRQRVSVELRKLEQTGVLRLGYRHVVFVTHAGAYDRRTGPPY